MNLLDIAVLLVVGVDDDETECLRFTIWVSVNMASILVPTDLPNI
jgi:hypothetical protein